MKVFSKSCKLMGSAFEFGIVGNSETEAKVLIEKGIAETQRIENLLTEFSPDSLTSQINANSGKKAIKVPNDFFQLFKRIKQISKITDGYFDITVGPLKKLYQFKRSNFKLPKKHTIENSLKQVGYNYVELDEQHNTVFLKHEKMHISFAAIGKGYAADMVKKLWQKEGVSSGYINASGDLTAFGKNENSALRKIGIANPDQPNNILFYVPLNHVSVATSGDYEQHFINNGKRYSHNINPKTGWPLTGIKSVSVFSPSAELSDALATAVYAMGTKKGVNFINALPQTHVIIIDDGNTTHFSKQLDYEIVY